MKYFIYFRPMFSKKGKFNGYDMLTTQRESEREGFDMLSIEGTNVEYLRLRTMLRDVDPFAEDQLYFVDKHPLQILNYIRTGSTQLPYTKNPNWESEIKSWKVDMKGDKI